MTLAGRESTFRRWARGASDLLETRGPHRAVVRRVLLPRLELIPPGHDEASRWRSIYGDFAGRESLNETLARTWLIASSRRAYGGLILSPIPCGLMLHTMRVPRPWRGVGIAGLLLAKVLEAQTQADGPIWLQVRPENTPAIRLYRRAEFQVVDPPAADMEREGHLLMRLDRLPQAASRAGRPVR